MVIQLFLKKMIRMSQIINFPNTLELILLCRKRNIRTVQYIVVGASRVSPQAASGITHSACYLNQNNPAKSQVRNGCK